jgi:hypothetical protein
MELPKLLPCNFHHLWAEINKCDAATTTGSQTVVLKVAAGPTANLQYVASRLLDEIATLLAHSHQLFRELNVCVKSSRCVVVPI